MKGMARQAIGWGGALRMMAGDAAGLRRHEDIGYLDAVIGLVALGAIHESMRGMGKGAVGQPPVHHLRPCHDGVPSPAGWLTSWQ